jgi:uncharacterized Ntn-hydrolase superfamily protein
LTISILAHEEKTGAFGGAACTGSLCVGGWVLRGDAESGLTATQGSLPSTLWGTQALALMWDGATAADAVGQVTAADAGRAQRQMAAIDLAGGTAHFTGADSIPAAGVRQAPGVVVAGNLLSSEAVLDACLDGFLAARGPLPDRLLVALEAAERAGGDSRGLQSSALLVVSRSEAPLTLRIDHSETPLAQLQDLLRRATTGDYAAWAALVPTLEEPERAVPWRP